MSKLKREIDIYHKENKWLELDDLFVSEIKQKEKLYKTCLEDVYKEGIKVQAIVDVRNESKGDLPKIANKHPTRDMLVTNRALCVMKKYFEINQV